LRLRVPGRLAPTEERQHAPRRTVPVSLTLSAALGYDKRLRYSCLARSL
jgi:hypothetical protein